MEESLATRAQRLNILVTSLISDDRDAEAANTIQRVISQAEGAVVALQLAEVGITNLEEFGLKRPVIQGPVRTEATQARTALRTTATAITGTSTQEMASRLGSASVSQALTVAVASVSKALTTQSRRAAEEYRQKILPTDLTEAIPAGSGVKDSVIIALKRIQNNLQQPIQDVDSPKIVADRLRNVVDLVGEWTELRPLVHAAAQQQHPEVRAFLAAAGTVEGARWSMVTDEVGSWLSDDSNSEAIRIHLR